MDVLIVLVGPLVAIVLLDLLAINHGVDSRDQQVHDQPPSMPFWAPRANR